MEFLQQIDQILSQVSLIFHTHGKLLGGIGIGLFLLVVTSSAMIFEGRNEAKKEQSNTDREKAINEGIAKGLLPEDMRERLSTRRAQTKKLTPLERTHLRLLSDFTDCAYKIIDPSVKETVFQLGALVNMICKRLRDEKVIAGSMRDFIDYHAPETLKVAHEYQQLSAKAMSNILCAELENTAKVLVGTKDDFMAYLTKYEEGEATRLAILSRTRQSIGKLERPHTQGAFVQLGAPEAHEDLLSLTGSQTRLSEKNLR